MFGGFGSETTTFGTSVPFGQYNNLLGAKPAANTGFNGQGFGLQPSTSGANLAGQSSSNGGSLCRQQPMGFGFGNTPVTSSGLFGQPELGRSLFTMPTTLNAVGATPAGFGGYSSATSGTVFSGTSMMAGSNGTTVKFNPPAGQDAGLKNGWTSSVNTRHMCITAMKEYENKSLEELRSEDYLANRKGQPAGGLFGFTPSTQASIGFPGIGQNPASFATVIANPTNHSLNRQMPSSDLFGQNKPWFDATTQPAANNGTFTFSGSKTPSSNPFSHQQYKLTFGNVATTQPNIFGNGSTQSDITTGFGPNSFSQQTQANLFGNKPAAVFGTTTTTTGFNFTGGNSLFAKPATSATQFTGFGNTTPADVFGNSKTLAIGTASSVQGPNAAPLMTTNPSSGQLQQQLITLTTSPFGDSPLFWNVQQPSAKREDLLKLNSAAAQKTTLPGSSQYKVSSHPRSKVRPQSLQAFSNGVKTHLFQGLEEDDSNFLGGNVFTPRKSVKKLLLRQLPGDVASDCRFISHCGQPPEPSSLDESLLGQSTASDLLTHNGQCKKNCRDTQDQHDTFEEFQFGKQGDGDENSSSTDAVPLSGDSETKHGAKPEVQWSGGHPAGIVLTRSDYYTIPNLEKLADMVDCNGDCLVKDFTVGRENYGSVFFPGITNVANLNLDDIVHFRKTEVVVYPDDDKKPVLGDGLNKPAEITLDNIWPTDKATLTPIKSPARLQAMDYQKKVEKFTAKIGAKFVDYRPETGSWVFQVTHFSRYGIDSGD